MYLANEGVAGCAAAPGWRIYILMPAAASTVRRLHDALAGARACLDARDEQTLESQVRLAEIPAPTDGEAERARWVAAALRARGLHPAHDAAGNVLALRPGSERSAPVVVCAHLDTVFDAGTSHAVQRESDRLVGPGIGDNARGLAAMLAIVEAVQAADVRTRRPLLFAATTGEEGAGDLRGARHLFATAASSAHAAIALDGAGDDRVVTHALGARRYRVTYHGAGGHSWASYGTPNAVHAAAGLAATLAAWPMPGLPRTTLSVSRIGGGSAVNAIPCDAWLEIDVRSTSPADLDRLDERIRRAAERSGEAENLRTGDGRHALRLHIASIGNRPGGALDGDAMLGHLAFEATRLIGRDPASAVASTDANVPLALGIPAIALGGGGVGGDAHTPHEWYENRDGALGIGRVLTIVASVAGLA